jgi:hypothetical protein
MSNNNKRFTLGMLTVLAAMAWGIETNYLFGLGTTSTLLSILGGVIIGIVGVTLAGKIE